MTEAMLWMAQQLAAASASGAADRRKRAPNPRPRGVMRDDGTSRLVREYLLEVEVQNGRAWVRRCEIVAAVDRSEKSVDAALRFLLRDGLIQCERDEARRSDGLWRIYRAADQSNGGGDNL